MNISEKLLNLRKAHNLTQEQLAEQLNVSRQSISKWESGQCIPDADKLKLLSDIFRKSTKEFRKYYSQKRKNKKYHTGLCFNLYYRICHNYAYKPNFMGK